MDDYDMDFVDELEDIKPPKMRADSMERNHEEGVINEGILFFDKFKGELWQICELDNAHYVKRIHMKEHLVECKKQVLKGPRKSECPFNPFHLINRMEMETHIMICPNRVTHTSSLCEFEPKRETIEGVRMAPVNFMPIIEDTWDREENPDSGYDPVDSTKFRMVLRPTPPNLSKAKRKAFRENERKRWKALGAETKEKPRAAPYPSRDELNSRRPAKNENSQSEEMSRMQSLISGLSGANIADPRDAALRKINDRLKIVQMLDARLNEEKLELQRLIEVYRAANIKTEAPPAVNADPRLAPRKPNENPEPSIASADHTSRILPDVMFSSIMR